LSSEHRAATRRRIFKSGTIKFGEKAVSSVPCAIRNLSDTGACLDLKSPLWFPNEFTLIVETDGVSKPCRLVWRKDRRIGIAFTDVQSKEKWAASAA
jgi:hypothetical protein